MLDDSFGVDLRHVRSQVVTQISDETRPDRVSTRTPGVRTRPSLRYSDGSGG